MDDILLVHTFLFMSKRDEYFGAAGRLTPMDGKLAPKVKTRENIFHPYSLNMLTRVLKHNIFTYFHGGKTVVKNFWEKALIVIHHGLIKKKNFIIQYTSY